MVQVSDKHVKAMQRAAANAGADGAQATMKGPMQGSQVISQAEHEALMKQMGVEMPRELKPNEIVGNSALNNFDGAEGIVNGVAGAAGMATFIAPGAMNLTAKAANKMGKTGFANKITSTLAEWSPEPVAVAAVENAPKMPFWKKMTSGISPQKWFTAKTDVPPPTKMQRAGDVAFAVSAGVSTYGVAKSFAGQLDSLKHAIADINGVPVEQISTTQALFGNIPKSLEPARDHLKKEHMVRGVAQAAGLVAMVLALRAKKHVPMVAFMAPGLVDMGANAVLGESVLPVYAELKNTHKAGMDIPVEKYSEFLMDASPELRKRGEVGNMVAMKLSEQFAAMKADPGAILREIDSGRFNQRIQTLLVEAEKAHAEQVAKAKAAQAEAAAHPQTKMVDRINGAVPARPVIGHHTGQVAAQMPTGPSIT